MKTITNFVFVANFFCLERLFFDKFETVTLRFEPGKANLISYLFLTLFFL